MFKQFIYYHFTKQFNKYQFHPLFDFFAKALEQILGLAIYNYDGVKVIVGPQGYLDRQIILGKSINPLLMRVLSENMKDGDVFLDIGANHGVLSLLAAKNPKVKVFAFEPSPRELTRMWKNLSLNPTNNISVISYGLGETEKTQTICLHPLANPGMNSLPEIINTGENVTCHFSSLSKLLNIDLIQQTRVCKIDIEGQEMFVLHSMRPYFDLLKHCLFVVEINPPLLKRIGYQPQDIYDFFSQVGFQPQHGNQENNIPSGYYWDDMFYHPSHVREISK